MLNTKPPLSRPFFFFFLSLANKIWPIASAYSSALADVHRLLSYWCLSQHMLHLADLLQMSFPSSPIFTKQSLPLPKTPISSYLPLETQPIHKHFFQQCMLFAVHHAGAALHKCCDSSVYTDLLERMTSLTLRLSLSASQMLRAWFT